jgi:hypothetical protein
MELTEAMRTCFTCRRYLPDPIPDEVFYAAVEVARFGPRAATASRSDS